MIGVAVVCRRWFGSVGQVRRQLHAELSGLFRQMDEGISPLSIVLPYAPTPAHRRRDAAHRQMVDLFAGVISRRRAREAPCGKGEAQRAKGGGQGGPEKPREAKRCPGKPRTAQRRPERPREAQGGPGRPRETQRDPARPKELHRSPVEGQNKQ